MKVKRVSDNGCFFAEKDPCAEKGLDILRYSPEHDRVLRESKDKDIDDDYDDDDYDEEDVYPFNRDNVTDEIKVLSQRSRINNEIDECLIDILSACREMRFHPDNFIEELCLRIRETFQSFKKRMTDRIEKYRDRDRQQSLNTILDERYPIEIRKEMLVDHCCGEYEKVKEKALQHDNLLRSRPHAGKTGPEDPLKEYNENSYNHIDVNKLVDKLSETNQ